MSNGDLWFINESGVITPLYDLARGYKVIDEITGVDLPPVAISSQPLFDRAGSLPLHVRFKERDVGVPFAVLGADVGQVRERVRVLTRALAPTQDGFLYLRVPGNVQPRALRCHLTDGLDGKTELLDDGGEAWMATVLNFRAFDPYWFDPVGTIVKFAFAGDEAVPFFPMFADPDDVGPHFGSSSIFGDQVITNVGDVVALPFWTLTGPMNSPLLQNVTTGETMDFSANGGLVIPAGHTVQINTSDQYVTARDDTGNSVLGYLTDTSTPFGLIVGDSYVHVEAQDTTAESLFMMAFAARWLSA